MGTWLTNHWPQVVTWALLIFSLIVSITTGIKLTRRSEQRERGKHALERIEQIEQDAIDYWTTGLTPGNPAVCTQSHLITRTLDRLEQCLEDISAHRLCRCDYLSTFTKFKQAVTTAPWQSSPRPPLAADDPRIHAISHQASCLANLIRECVVRTSAAHYAKQGTVAANNARMTAVRHLRNIKDRLFKG